MKSHYFVFGCCVLAMACVDRDLSEREKRELAKHTLAQKPDAIPHQLAIDYAGKVQLLGYELTPEGPVAPGEELELTLFWKAEKDLPEGWSLFTHVLDAAGERILNIDNVGPLRRFKGGSQALPPGDWQAGKYYVDKQTFRIPDNIKTDRVQIVTGVWKDDQRLKIVKGPHDRGNRGIVTELIVSPGAKQRVRSAARTPFLRVDKLKQGTAIKVDGKLGEDAWKQAAVAGPFVNVNTGKANRSFPVDGSVKLTWNEQGMYFGFRVRDPDVVGGFDKDAKDPHLWTKDTIEIMIDPEGNGDNKDYVEIQVNPQGLVFDSRFDTYNQPRKGPDGPFGHESWSSGIQAAVSIDGTLDDASDKDRGYTVEAMLPWKSLEQLTEVPPEPGTTWRMNFYAMQNNGGVAWSPILKQGNFHKASRFGRVQFVDKSSKPEKAKALELPKNSREPKSRFKRPPTADAAQAGD